MILDIHTHVWSNLEQLGREIAGKLRSRWSGRLSQLDASASAHERAMTCVDGALVLGLRSDRLGLRIPNELIAEFVSKDPRRRIGVCGIDPMSADALDQLEAGRQLGLVGAVVSPACQGFHPAHSAAMRVYERCAELSMPLFVTTIEPLTETAVLEFGRPVLWDEVAQSFPSLPIVIGQLGHPWIDEMLLMLGKHSNLHASISGVASRPWQLYNALLSAASMGVMDKLLFGSGFPLSTPARTIEAIYSVNSYSHGTQLPSVPRSLVRAIVERDSLSCLGIESEIAARHGAAVEDEAPAEVAVLADNSTLAGERFG
ncbi:MAG: amidohydrolase [Phycisphaerales bacterium]|nr:amidohydrolase [Phycisphaerales bacterium]MCI0631345.1 amidohydrolase [Phycisphaerales bacterium]MCI0675121.1 amidohydrolase [Phycisphaerales bacterium]